MPRSSIVWTSCIHPCCSMMCNRSAMRLCIISLGAVNPIISELNGGVSALLAPPSASPVADARSIALMTLLGFRSSIFCAPLGSNSWSLFCMACSPCVRRSCSISLRSF